MVEGLRDLQDVIGWCHRAEGRYEALWAAQLAENSATKKDIDDHGRRLGALEQRVMWYAGAAAMIGAALGGFVGRLLP